MLYNTYVHTVPEMLYGCRQYVSEAMSVGISKNILCHQSKSYLNNVTFSPLVTELDLHLKTDTAVIYADCKLINLMFFWPCIMNWLYIDYQFDAPIIIYS